MHNIEPKIKKIVSDSSKDEFIFDFLLAYNIPKSTIKRAREWDLNKLEEKWEFFIRKKIFFKITDDNLYSNLDDIKISFWNSKIKPRFIIVTDYDKIISYDTRIWDTLDVEFVKLYKHYNFFLPLSWIEKQSFQDENSIDRKAAYNMAKLYDEIEKTDKDSIRKHDLNIFFSRLLFCYFAEDTNIFKDNQFTKSLASNTKADWSDTHIFLEKLFNIFDEKNRDDSTSEYLKVFPYVNGKLFQDNYQIPRFTIKSRNFLIELWKLDRSSINPDIFWSMMQAVMDPEERENLWSHYTSVPNILKVIYPLFLDKLYKEFEERKWNQKQLTKLLERLWNIKFFDPACGSGNFLIITYKEIRRLEIKIMKEIWVWWTFGHSYILLSQFYGIELNDFAHESAKLSLYLAEHQMNIEFEREIWISTESLPLKLWWNIVCGNATRIDRAEVCPKEDWNEIYIMWNPPYYWSRKQTKSQKADLEHVFKVDYKSLDYISARFYLWANFIRWVNAKLAFVTTNSINQWIQVALTWPRILKDNVEINFAYRSFKWKNNAKDNANVIVSIVWLSNTSNDEKYIFSDNLREKVQSINAYLSTWDNIYVVKRSSPLNIKLKPIIYWSMLNDNWYLILSKDEKQELENMYPVLSKYIKMYLGAKEYLNGYERWCFDIPSADLDKVKDIPEIQDRLKKVQLFRENSTEASTRKMANNPNRFYFYSHTNWVSIIIPRTSSERRDYIPIWFLDDNTIISDAAQALYNAEHRIFWVITSRMHMVRMRKVAWRLKSDYRYSWGLVYNTFPFPYITKKQKNEIEEFVYQILDERERHTEKTLAQMYDPKNMPEWLKEAHHQLDHAIEKCYRPKAFENDDERLWYLFKMYEKMIAKEKNN